MIAKLALSLTAAFLVLQAPPLYALDIVGTDAGETLTGTDNADNIQGRGGHDTLRGRGGGDSLTGDSGDDIFIGGGGKDRYKVDDGALAVCNAPDIEDGACLHTGNTDEINDYEAGEVINVPGSSPAWRLSSIGTSRGADRYVLAKLRDADGDGDKDEYAVVLIRNSPGASKVVVR